MWILWLSFGVCIGAAIVIGIEIALIWQLYVKPLRDQRESKERGDKLADAKDGKDTAVSTTPDFNGGNLTSEQKKVRKKLIPLIQLLKSSKFCAMVAPWLRH
jgi:hypothetical protein